MPKLITALVVALLATLNFSATPAAAQESFTREHGWIETSDGVRLKYTVLLPPGNGPWPVVFQYEGYNAGSFPDRGFETWKNELLADGYAILGVSIRGTACSGGVFDLFSRDWAADGATAIEWAAAQPWSNGRIGMFSLSFAGIMQLWVAAEEPKHLVSIAPGQVVADTYRDVGYPGGIPNDTFPPLWMAAMQAEWAEAIPLATQDGDTECLANQAAHPPLNAPGNFVLDGFQHQTADDWHTSRSALGRLDRIDVPVLGMTSWQDEQTGPRGGHHFDHLDPEQTWIVQANGPHVLYTQSPRFLRLLHDWFDWTLKGIDNGFATSPRVQIWHEVDAGTRDPAWVTTDSRWPIARTPWPLSLHEDGVLTNQPAETAPASSTYSYPIPGPPGGYEAVGGGWTNTPIIPAGTVAFTTGPLPTDVTVVGEGSADLWISATAPDVDLQVTLTEVRPDGQELYVQRGWLRASHRAVDEAASTALRPVHPHLEDQITNLPLGEPVLARVEINPFGHTFRAGSAIRLLVDTPSLTGLWNFLLGPTPAQVTVHHDAEYPSRLVLGVLDTADAPVPLPACGSLYAQACRADSIGVPDVAGPRPPGSNQPPSADSAPTSTPPAGQPLPSTGGGLALAGIVALAAAAARRSR